MPQTAEIPKNRNRMEEFQHGNYTMKQNVIEDTQYNQGALLIIKSAKILKIFPTRTVNNEQQ